MQDKNRRTFITFAIVWSVWVYWFTICIKSKHFVVCGWKSQTITKYKMILCFFFIDMSLKVRAAQTVCNKVAINDQYYWFWNGNHTLNLSCNDCNACTTHANSWHHLFNKKVFVCTKCDERFFFVVSFDCCWSMTRMGIIRRRKKFTHRSKWIKQSICQTTHTDIRRKDLLDINIINELVINSWLSFVIINL